MSSELTWRSQARNIFFWTTMPHMNILYSSAVVLIVLNSASKSVFMLRQLHCLLPCIRSRVIHLVMSVFVCIHVYMCYHSKIFCWFRYYFLSKNILATTFSLSLNASSVVHGFLIYNLPLWFLCWTYTNLYSVVCTCLVWTSCMGVDKGGAGGA